MKNKSKIYLFVILLYSSLSCNLLANEFIFDASEINISDNGNIIDANIGTATTIDNNIKIKAKNFHYDKTKFILEAFGDVEVVSLENKILINSENISYNTKDKIILSNTNTKIKDAAGNIFLMENFIYTLQDDLIKLGRTKILDIEKNNYQLNKAYLNLKSNKLIGKDIVIDFNNTSFEKDNEPRLKGNSIISNGNKSIVTKGVFTTCKKNDNCPPWQLTAKEISHDKEKQIIYYKDAWLKVYDKPIFYFPRFFHPDPTVKRQSGFLMPTFQSSSGLGTSLITPYFHVLSGNKDLTVNPRFYSKNKLLLQTEYRGVAKDSSSDLNFSFLKEKNKSFTSHFFSKFKKKIDFFNFEESNIALDLQHTSKDSYLKSYKIKSPLITSDTLLESALELNAYNDDLSLSADIRVYEDLTKPDKDRYEFVYPNYNILKEFETSPNLNGSFSLNSHGYIKHYNTNINEKVVINDLTFNSNIKIFNGGFKNNYTYLIKNSNTEASNSSNYKDNLDNKLDAIFKYNSSLPLIKETENFKDILNPSISLKYSPNKTKNMKDDDIRLDTNNIFALNRLGTSTSVEGGTSLTYGVEYSKSDKSENEIIGAKLANIFRPKINTNLPIKSGLNEKNSDIVGQVTLTPNDNLKMNYDFSLDNNLADTTYQLLGSEIKINNFVTTFEYLNENNPIGSKASSSSYLSNTSTISNDDKSKSLSFNTRQNKTTKATEFYNLIYQYRNDCLIAGIEYNKDYYRDGDLKPEENIFFKLTIIPFGKTSTPNLK